MPSVNALIPLAQGCEDLEAVTLIDLFRRAKINVTTVSLDDKPVTCARRTTIIADKVIDDVLNETFDLVVLPGGLPGADNLNADPRIHQIINQHAEAKKYIAAICAAPKVLVDNGVLDGKKLTAFPGALNQTDTRKVTLNDNAIQIDGNIITSKGPGTAMDFALTLIETLLGSEARKKAEEPLQRS